MQEKFMHNSFCRIYAELCTYGSAEKNGQKFPVGLWNKNYAECNMHRVYVDSCRIRHSDFCWGICFRNCVTMIFKVKVGKTLLHICAILIISTLILIVLDLTDMFNLITHISQSRHF